MKLTAIIVVLCTIAFTTASQKLLGADDVDFKHAEMSNPEPPKQIHSKDDAKKMREDMQQKRVELKELKSQLKSGSELTKSEKESKRQRFNLLKLEIKAERSDLSMFAVEQLAETKDESNRAGKKHRGNKHGQKKSRKDGKKGKKHGKENKEPETEVVEEVAPRLLTKAQLKEQRRAERRMLKKEGRAERKGMKPDMLKGETVPMADSLQMMADSPRLPVREEKHKEKKGRQGKKHRKTCETKTDCEDSEVCSMNKHGHKVCFPMKRMDRKENKKCLSTQQCGRGLRCFIAENAPTLKDKRRRGVCKNADKMSEEQKAQGNFLAQ